MEITYHKPRSDNLLIFCTNYKAWLNNHIYAKYLKPQAENRSEEIKLSVFFLALRSSVPFQTLYYAKSCIIGPQWEMYHFIIKDIHKKPIAFYMLKLSPRLQIRYRD